MRIPRRWPPAPALQWAPSGTSAASPAHPLCGVLDQDALARKLIAQTVGAGKIARLLGQVALVDQFLDAYILGIASAAPQPVGRVLLQQTKQLASGKQFAFQAGFFR